MCITINKAELADTKILVVAGVGNTQLTVYSNHASTGAGNAMILPVPTTRNLRMVDMTDFEKIFTDIDAYFPDDSLGMFDAMTLSTNSRSRLEVHQVGSYRASIVPSLADLDRLDDEFNLSASNVREVLKDHYANFGFVVCRLSTGSRTYEPFAYVHEYVDEMFVPTRHYHGGAPEAKSFWDHAIYAVGCLMSDSAHANRPSVEVAMLCRHAEIVPLNMSMSKVSIDGYYDNYDVTLFLDRNLDFDSAPTFVAPDGCKFFSEVAELNFTIINGATAPIYRGRPLQATRFTRQALRIVGKRVHCYYVCGGFAIKGVVSGNVWTYRTNDTGSGMIELSA